MKNVAATINDISAAVVGVIKGLIVAFVFANILYTTGMDPIGGIVSLVDAGARTNDIDQATEGFGRYPLLQAMWNDDFLAMFYLITSGAETDLHMQPASRRITRANPKGPRSKIAYSFDPLLISR